MVRREVVEAIIDMVFQSAENYDSLSSSCSELFSKGVKTDRVAFSPILNEILVTTLQSKLRNCSSPSDLPVMRKIFGFVGRLVSEPPVAGVLAESILYAICIQGFQECPQHSCLYLEGACELAKHSEFHETMMELNNLKAVLEVIETACKQLSQPTVAVVMYHGSLKEESVPGIVAVKLLEKLIEKAPDCASKVTELGLLNVVSSSFLAQPVSVEFEPPASDVAAKRTYAVSPTSVAFWEALSSLLALVFTKNASLVSDVKDACLVRRCSHQLQGLGTTLGDWSSRVAVYEEAVAAHGLQVLNGLLMNADLSREFLNQTETCDSFVTVIMSYAFQPETLCPSYRQSDRQVFRKQSRACVNSICITSQGRQQVSSMASGYFVRCKDIKDLMSHCTGFGDQLRCAVADAGLLIRFAAEAVVASHDHQKQDLAIALAEMLLQFADIPQEELWDELRDAWMKSFVVISDDLPDKISSQTCCVPSNVLTCLQAIEAQGTEDGCQYSALNLLLMLLGAREFDSLPLADQDAIREKVNEKEKKKPEPEVTALPGSDQKAPWPWRLRSIVFQILAQLLKKPKDEQKQNGDKNKVKPAARKQVDDREEKGKAKNRVSSLQGSNREEQSSDVQNDIQPDINYSPRQDQSPNRLNNGLVVESGQDHDQVSSDSSSPVCVHSSSSAGTDVTTFDTEVAQMKGSSESLSTAVPLDTGSHERSSGSESKLDGKSGSLNTTDAQAVDISRSLQFFKGATIDYFKGLFSPLERGMIVPDLKSFYAVSIAESICNQSSRADNLMRDILVDSNWLESAREVAKYYDEHFELLELEPERLIKRAKLKEEEAAAAAREIGDSDQGDEGSSGLRNSGDGFNSSESDDGAAMQNMGESVDEIIVDESSSTMAVVARREDCTVGIGLAKVGLFLLGLADPAAVGIRLIQRQSKAPESKISEGTGSELEPLVAVGLEMETTETSLDSAEIELHLRILKNCLDSLVELAHISNLRTHFWASSLPDQLQALASRLINCTHPSRIKYDSKAEDLAFESLHDEEHSTQSPKSVRHTLLTNISSVFWDLSAGGYKAGRELHQQDILPLLLDLIDYGEEYVQKAGAATLVNTSINSLKFGAKCRHHPGFLDRVLVAWKRSVGSDALNKKIAWTLNRIGWDYYPYCTYVALHGGLSTVLELAFMNEVIEDEMLADILDTTHMMLWIPHWSCRLSLQTYSHSHMIDSNDGKLDRVDSPENFTVVSEQNVRYLGRLQLKTVLRLLELVDEPLHVSARQSLLHILCLMGIRERCVAEVFLKHFSHRPIHYTVTDVIHAGYLKLVPHLMGVTNGQLEFSRAEFLEKHLSPFKSSLTTETPIASRVIRVLIVLTNHCAWMAEELVRLGCFEVMTKHLDMLSVDNIADYAQIIAMVLVQYEPSLSVFKNNVKLEFLTKLIDDEDVEKRCSAVKCKLCMCILVRSLRSQLRIDSYSTIAVSHAVSYVWYRCSDICCWICYMHSFIS